MDRIDFLGFVLLLRDISRLDRYSTQQYVVLFNRWFLGIENAVANYIMITEYGFVGAAVASAATLTFVNLLRIFKIMILEKYNPYTRKYLKPIVTTLIVAMLLEGIQAMLLNYGISEIPRLISGGIIGTLCYVAVIYFLGIDDIDYEIYRELRGKE